MKTDDEIKILHLEDYKSDARLVLEILKKTDLKFEYFLADNEKDFLSFLEKNNIDLILSDFSLPDYSGNEALQVVKKNYPDIPFIFVSGVIGEDVAIDSLLNGATDYVLKNKMERLIPAVKRAIVEVKEKETLRLAEKALYESEKRFQQLFNEAPLGYQSLDNNGFFIEVNQKWLETLGYTRDEVIGKWFGDFLSPGYQEGFRNRFPIFKAQGQIHSEFQMVHKNGTLLFIAFEGKVGNDLNGNFKQTHCILQDITEQKKAEMALKEKMDELQRFHNLTVGRELTMIELKKEVNSLLKELSREEKYRIIE